MSEQSPPDDETPFERKMRERLELKAAQKSAQKAAEEANKHSFEPDLIPEDPYDLSEADKALDDAVKRIDIIDGYIKYCGKMMPKVRNGQRENIMVSCPIPGHKDAKPSAWINLDKQTWMCGKCEQGGDVHDLAAIAKGYNWPNTYKSDGSFHKLRAEMAADFGFVTIRGAGGAVIVATPEEEPPPPPVKPEPVASTPEPENNVTALRDENEDEDDNFNVLIPVLDWDKLLEPGTFLDEYMKATRVDDVPEEYHLFHGLMALGLALGRDVTLFDSVPVYGNLFVCTLGRSGSGKSKAKYHLDRLIERALPYSGKDENSKGTKRINSPGSAEVLIYNFQKPVPDPTDPKKIAYNAPVRGLIEFNEMASLIARGNRMGSAIKPTLMSFFDMERSVATSSMTHGLKEASEPFACAITSTQPKAIKNMLGTADDSSGFLNRWTFILGTPKKRFAIGGTMVDVTPAVEPLSKILGWASTFLASEQIQWSQEAFTRYTEFFHSRIEPDKKASETDLITRIDLMLKKLVLLFTANERLKEVPLKSVERAIELYDFLIAGYNVPAGQLSSSVYSEIQTAVMSVTERYLKKTGRGMTAAELSRSLWRRGYNQVQLKNVLDAMVAMGTIELVTTKPGDRGRPSIRYRYVKPE